MNVTQKDYLHLLSIGKSGLPVTEVFEKNIDSSTNSTIQKFLDEQPDSVIDELLCLQNDYGVEHIVWLDDDLLKDEKRTIHMFNEMVRRNVKLTWDATNGVIAHSLKKFEVVDAA